MALIRRVLDAAHPNPHTRNAYKRALAAFLTWLDAEQIGMRQAKPYDIRQLLETMKNRYQPETINHTWL